jgi:hypothetical protein
LSALVKWPVVGAGEVAGSHILHHVDASVDEVGEGCGVDDDARVLGVDLGHLGQIEHGFLPLAGIVRADMRKPARFPERVEEDAGGWRAATGRSRERWRLRQGIDVA